MPEREEGLFEGILKERDRLLRQEMRRKRNAVYNIVTRALLEVMPTLSDAQINSMLDSHDRFPLEFLCSEMIKRSEAKYGKQFQFKPTEDTTTLHRVIGIYKFDSLEENEDE